MDPRFPVILLQFCVFECSVGEISGELSCRLRLRELPNACFLLQKILLAPSLEARPASTSVNKSVDKRPRERYDQDVPKTISSTNVRISGSAHLTLRRLARIEGSPMQAILDKALEQYRRETFLRAANADIAALKKDKKAWKEELAERRLWDKTLTDGAVE